MSEEFLTKDDYLTILQNKFYSSNIKIINANWLPLSENVEGDLGEHYILDLKFKLEEKDRNEKFFIKVSQRKSEFFKKIASDMNVYEKEIFMYQKIFKEFGDLKFIRNFAPEFYFSKNKDVLVMDNKLEKGYKVVDPSYFFDLNHVKAVLNSLAIFHANSFGLEETNSKKMGRNYKLNEGDAIIFKETLYKPNVEDSPAMQFLKAGLASFLAIIDLIPESLEWKQQFEDKLKNFNLSKIFSTNLPYRKSFVHGDLWSNNLLFKYQNGKPIHCCLVDFQQTSYYYPFFDVILIIYLNTRKSLRDNHFKYMLDFYYETFEEVLKKYGFEANSILPKSQYLEGIESLKPLAYVHAVADRTFKMLPDEIKNQNTLSGSEMEGLIFSQGRGRILADFIKNKEELIEIVIEDAHELYNYL